MGEPNVELLEQTVKNNAEDIREIKKKVEHHDSKLYQLESTQQLTNQSLSHVLDAVSELKMQFKEMDDKLDKNTVEQLKQYKSAVWKVGVTVIAGVLVSVIGGFLLFSFGLK